MPKKKKDEPSKGYSKIFGDVAKRIGKYKYDTENPEKAAPTKGKKSDTNTKQEYKIKGGRPERLADEDLYKSQEEGLAELKALRDKQRKRADEFKKRR